MRTVVTGGGGRTISQWRRGCVFLQLDGSAGVHVINPQTDVLCVHSRLREVDPAPQLLTQ